MIKKDFIITLVIPIFGFLGCKKDNGNNECIGYVNAPIVKIEGPSEGRINEDINLKFFIQCSNSCGNFEKFEEVADDDTTIINAIAKYEGCACADYLKIVEVNYRFKASQPGTYYLKFLQQNKSYLRDTIIIQ